jgi:hypothetical protein
MVETIKLGWLKMEAERVNILPWEEDGGKIVEITACLSRHVLHA